VVAGFYLPSIIRVWKRVIKGMKVLLEAFKWLESGKNRRVGKETGPDLVDRPRSQSG
jgi:hypothetical protein